MAQFSTGQRIVASWLGGAWEPATVIEVGAGGMLKVRFDDGREVFLAAMNARAAPGNAVAPAAALRPTADAPPPPPPDGFHPIAPAGQQGSPPAIPPTLAQPPMQPPPVSPVAPTFPAQMQPPPVSPVAPTLPAQPAMQPPVSPIAPTMPVQTVNPALPASPPAAPPPGEFKPIQGAPLDGPGGAMPPGFNPFEPSGGKNNG